VLLVLAAGWWTLRVMDRRGRQFFETGREINTFLDAMAAALRDADWAQFDGRYGERFRGKKLGLPGLGRHAPRQLLDGVRIYQLRQVSPGMALPETAVAEWHRYRGGFAAVEEVRFSLERLERWDEEEILAVVHFGLIGTPHGEPRPAVDRALLRLGFERGDGGELLIRRSSAIRGDRTIAAAPQFREIGAEAGINFEHRFYPGYLEQAMPFAMVRYGPGGITAADYDDDGFHDLFVPDGVESRLLRNRRDGSFEDVTAAAGLSGLSGASVGLFADYDNDGHKDLFVSRTFEPNQLFHANGDGSFEDVTAGSGLGADCCTTVASWADYDLDGDLDLYVGRYLDPRTTVPTTFYARNGEPNRLYRNDGDGRFTDVTAQAGVGEPGLCLGTVFGDYDDDGDPDLYVVNDFGRKTLYRNEGADGSGVVRFTDVTVETGTLAYGAGMSASFADYDNDGDLDLYVAHIRTEEAWFAARPTLWRFVSNNLRQWVWPQDVGLFRQIYRQSGNDFLGVLQQMSSGNTLLRNRRVRSADGAGEEVVFEDVSAAAGANPFGWFWGSSFADFDNDGWQDLYSANGWVYNERGTETELRFLNAVVGQQRAYKQGEFFDPAFFDGRSWHGWERNRHLRNLGDGTFHEIGRAAGTDLLLNSRGIAVADFFNRGALDIAVAASTDRHALLRNETGTRRHWLELELQGGAGRLPKGTNRDAVGVRVTLKAGGLTQVREVVLGDGYGSQNALRLHFGLGDSERVEELTLRWPVSGEIQSFQDFPADRILTVVEGSSALSERSPLPAETGGPGTGSADRD
jgi:hypothetical protein